jgi:imidazolonepropionase-like amidohydrolase
MAMTVLLAGADILDVESGSTERADILLRGDRIAAVGLGLSGDERVDCNGGLLIPGLIDCHAHVAFPPHEPLPRSARILEAAAVLRCLLTRGVTTVRDGWGADAGFSHAHTASSAAAAAQAGVRSIEHGVFLNAQAIAAMRQHQCWYVPTLAGVHSEGDDAYDAAHRRSVQLALAAGVPIAAGSDMAMRPHVDLLTELRLLSQAGLGDSGALRAATSEAARLLRLDHDRGRVAPGLRADLVLLDGSGVSLEDLLGRIRAVWQSGRLVPAHDGPAPTVLARN